MPYIYNQNLDEINLSEYIFNNYDKYYDLTEGRYLSLQKLMNAYNGHAIKVSQLRQVFGLDGFFNVLSFVGNMDNFDTMVQYGQMCLAEYQEQLSNDHLANHLSK